LTAALNVVVFQTAPGSFQEYIARNWVNVLPVPSTSPTRSAAAIAISGFTALTFITEAYAAKPGEWVLVHAAAGSLGTFLCQLLSAKGVHMIGTTSTPQKAEIAKANGAEVVIVTSQEDTVKRVLEVTGGEGVHGVYDGIGKDTCVITTSKGEDLSYSRKNT
jgi:NADPH:quinone reductase